ncbi:hypothetical protein SKAU_G00171320 [Synaphobranchus kaupii]|uniref:Uncharacterized protein n=1 Tax=Synaphobranchus kaupii TaxID=118154 RepID=A0A9Q1FKF5_SYNKA|nr:hypothetical protein SKAU_G00171320 [Synaphobranchus kaupii]
MLRFQGGRTDRPSSRRMALITRLRIRRDEPFRLLHRLPHETASETGPVGGGMGRAQTEPRETTFSSTGVAPPISTA